MLLSEGPSDAHLGVIYVRTVPASLSIGFGFTRVELTGIAHGLHEKVIVVADAARKGWWHPAARK